MSTDREQVTEFLNRVKDLMVEYGIILIGEMFDTNVVPAQIASLLTEGAPQSTIDEYFEKLTSEEVIDRYVSAIDAINNQG